MLTNSSRWFLLFIFQMFVNRIGAPGNFFPGIILFGTVSSFPSSEAFRCPPLGPPLGVDGPGRQGGVPGPAAQMTKPRGHSQSQSQAQSALPGHSFGFCFQWQKKFKKYSLDVSISLIVIITVNLQKHLRQFSGQH